LIKDFNLLLTDESIINFFQNSMYLLASADGENVQIITNFIQVQQIIKPNQLSYNYFSLKKRPGKTSPNVNL